MIERLHLVASKGETKSSSTKIHQNEEMAGWSWTRCGLRHHRRFDDFCSCHLRLLFSISILDYKNAKCPSFIWWMESIRTKPMYRFPMYTTAIGRFSAVTAITAITDVLHARNNVDQPKRVKRTSTRENVEADTTSMSNGDQL